jgi:hypothetical protein
MRLSLEFRHAGPLSGDSWPHRELVEHLNSINPTPRERWGLPWLISDIQRSMDIEMPIMLWPSSAYCVDSVTCAQGLARNSLSFNRPRRHSNGATATSNAGEPHKRRPPQAGFGDLVPTGVTSDVLSARQGPLDSHFLGLPTIPRRPRSLRRKKRSTLRICEQERIRRTSLHGNVIRIDSDAGGATPL